MGDKLVFATDSIVIGAFLPISALTYYAIGGTLIEQLRTFVTSMASILNPLSSSLDARKQTGALAVVVVTGAKAAMLLGLPLCIGFILLGSRFIYIWMGAEYAGPAGVVLAVLSVGHLIGLPYYTISGVLYGLGRHRVVAMSRIFEGVVNVALSIALITRYGLVGVALGTIIPHIIVVAGILPSSLPRWMPLNLREYLHLDLCPAVPGGRAVRRGVLVHRTRRGARRLPHVLRLHDRSHAILSRAGVVHRADACRASGGSRVRRATLRGPARRRSDLMISPLRPGRPVRL